LFLAPKLLGKVNELRVLLIALYRDLPLRDMLTGSLKGTAKSFGYTAHPRNGESSLEIYRLRDKVYSCCDKHDYASPIQCHWSTFTRVKPP
jgi:hypothetical protein